MSSSTSDRNRMMNFVPNGHGSGAHHNEMDESDIRDGFAEASLMLSSALEQLDGIIAGLFYLSTKSALFHKIFGTVLYQLPNLLVLLNNKLLCSKNKPSKSCRIIACFLTKRFHLIV